MKKWRWFFAGWVCSTVVSLFVGLWINDAAGQSRVVDMTWNHGGEPDLAGFKIYYGMDSTNLDNVADIPLSLYDQNPASVPVIRDWIQAGTWYFAATAYDTNGNESARSEMISAAVPDTAPGTPRESVIKVTFPDGTVVEFRLTQ